MGIDPSINSTGICIYIKDNNINEHIYFNIVGHATKKMKSFEHKFINIIDYEKGTDKLTDYSDKEIQKTSNIYKICDCIEELIKKFNPDKIIMEGVSYGSVGSAALVDLSGLNFAIRIIVKKLNKDIQIISPLSVKKFAIANGQADKQVLINAWKKIDKNISDVQNIKIDDLADSFFIAHYVD